MSLSEICLLGKWSHRGNGSICPRLCKCSLRHWFRIQADRHVQTPAERQALTDQQICLSCYRTLVSLWWSLWRYQFIMRNVKSMKGPTSVCREINTPSQCCCATKDLSEIFRYRASWNKIRQLPWWLLLRTCSPSYFYQNAAFQRGGFQTHYQTAFSSLYFSTLRSFVGINPIEGVPCTKNFQHSLQEQTFLGGSLPLSRSLCEHEQIPWLDDLGLPNQRPSGKLLDPSSSVIVNFLAFLWFLGNVVQGVQAERMNQSKKALCKAKHYNNVWRGHRVRLKGVAP